MLDIHKVYEAHNFGKFKVINYIDCTNVEVEFIATKFRTTTQAGHIKRGLVKDLLHPIVYGVGYTGVGIHSATLKGKATKAYKTWTGMLERCYCPTAQEKHPTYIGCTVDPIWHNLQNFVEWFNENYSEGLHLDKDILVSGNKVYSPATCAFVTRAENNIQAQAKNYVVVDPHGIEHRVYNMAEFCRKHTLAHPHMSSVLRGVRNSHKGWTRAKDK